MPEIKETGIINGSCMSKAPLDDAAIFLSVGQHAVKANISEGSVYLGYDFKADSKHQQVIGGSLMFGTLKQGETYTIRVWSEQPGCFTDVTVKTSVTDCERYGDVEGFVDKPHAQIRPKEDLRKSAAPCGPGLVMTTSCEGQNMTLNKGLLNQERFIALHGNCGAGSSILPACLAYVDEDCNVFSEEYAFCFDYNKASGLGSGFSPGTVQFTTQVGIDGIDGLDPLKAARISWVFEHLDDYGLTLTNSTHRRAMQLISWKIINPNEPGVQEFNCDNAALPRVCSGAGNLSNWCDIFDAAMAAVPDNSEIPNLALSPSEGSALINQSIQLVLTTNENEIDLMVSDGGDMPTLCNGSEGEGHQIIDNGNGTGQLIINGSGLNNINLCFSREVSSNFTFEAEVQTTISDGSSFVIYIPDEPYEEEVQPFFSYNSSVLTPKASAELEFLGDLTLECAPDLEFECVDFDASFEADWIGQLEITSDCGVSSVTSDFDPNGFTGEGCEIAGVQVVTFTVVDNCGQTETCQATVTVTNNQDIEWDFLPSDATVDCSTPIPSTMATAFDNCGQVTVTFDDVTVPGACEQSFTIIRTFTATDECNNTNQHIQTIEVVDNTPPTFGDGSDCWPSGLTSTSFDSDAEASSQFDELLFSANGQIGNNAQGGDYELSLENVMPFNVLDDADLTWPQGQNVAFTIMYNPNAAGDDRLVYTVTSGTTQRILKFNPEMFYDFPLDIDGIVLSTQTAGNTTVSLSNIQINGQSLAGTFGSNNPSSSLSTHDVITGASLEEGFTIEGNALFDWSGAPPSGSDMSFAFSFGKLSCAPGTSCPEDITIDCSDPLAETTLTNWLENVTATDDCGDAEVTNDFSGDLICGEYLVTFTATDDCGNQSTCQANLTISGQEDPSISVGDAPSLVCGDDNNLALIQSWLETAVAFGSCGQQEVSTDLDAQAILDALQSSGFTGENCVSTVTVNFEALDECGILLQTSAQITLSDNIAPEITCPSDLVLECGNVNNADLIDSWINDVIGIDNCTEVDIINTYSPNAFSSDCGLTGTQVVVFTASDACGNTSTCEAAIIIQDNTPPFFTVVPSDLTLSCNDDVPSSLAEADDLCGGAVVDVTESILPGVCPGDEIITRTFIATDDCGNTAVHTQTISIVDDQAPTFTFVPADMTLGCDDDVVMEDAQAVDECGSVILTEDVEQVQGSCPSNVTIIRTFTATDDCGNSAEATQTITVVDEIAPEFTFVPADYTASCDEDLTLDNAEATDNCGSVNISVDETTQNQGCDQAFVLTRVFTATDECGNQSQATQVITVFDNEAPEFTSVPDDITFDCNDDDLNTAIQNWLGSVSAIDNCSDVNISNDYSTLEGCGTSTVTFTVTDDCGNIAEATAQITIENSQDPEVLIGDAPELVCGDSDNLTVLSSWIASATASGNCGSVDITTNLSAEDIIDALESNLGNGGNGCEASLEVTFSFEDLCEGIITLTKSVSISDNINPEIVCPENLVLECGNPDNDGLISTWLDSVVATDNCVEPNVENSYDSNGFSNECGLTGSQVVVFTATDNCGNSASCSATIILEDTTPPAFTMVPEDLTLGCNDDIPSSTAEASDDCGTADVVMDETITEGQCPSNFTITRTFTATDECGNSSTHVQTIVVEDNEAPEFTFLPGDMTLSCEDEVIFESAEAIDNCGDITIGETVTEELGVCEENITITRTFTATDECGNVVTGVQVITILDEEAPMFTFVPEDYTIDCSEDLILDEPTATDNCSGVSISEATSIEELGCPQTYILTRTFTATDDCGNEATAVQVINVVDNQAPVFTSVPEALTVACDEDNITSVIQSWLGEAAATDNCGNVVINNDYSESLACGVYTIDLVAEDECGNTATETTTLTITGSGELEIIVPEAPLLNCGSEENLGLIQDWLDAVVAVGGCDDVEVLSDLTAQEILDLLEGSLIDAKGECQLVIDVIFSTSDACGDVVEVEAEITIFDSDPPVIECPEELTIECGDPNIDQIIEDWLASVSATDNCSEVEITDTYFEGGFTDECGQTGTQFVFFTASDACGNQANCISTITIVDTTPPQFTSFPEDLTLSCTDDIPDSSAEASDDCGNVEVVMEETVEEGDCPQSFDIIRTFTATDECGNETQQTQTITIIDDEAPEFTFVPENVTLNCDEPIDLEDALATDNCSDVTITYEEQQEVGDCENEFTITRTITATDECGNSTQTTQIITVIDETAPEFTFVPVPFEIECIESGIEDQINDWLNSANAEDNCGDVSLSNNYNGSLACGEYFIVFTATDACGNTTTEESSFTITGSGSVEINVPEAPLLDCGSPDNLSLIQGWLDSVNATGGCDDLSVESNLTAQEILDLLEGSLIDAKGECQLVIDVIFSTSDICGDAIEVEAEISIFDSEPPVIECPEDLVVECGDPDFDLIISDWLASVTATDNCSEVEITNTYFAEGFSDECGQTGTQFVFFTAADACGNQSNCIASISIVDTTPPSFVSFPDDLTISCEDDVPGSSAEAVDECGNVTIEVEETTVEGDCPQTFQIIRVFTATDECENSTSQTQTITVIDDEAPIFTSVPQDYTANCDEALVYDSAEAEDNCGNVDITDSRDTIFGECEGEFIINRIFTATDECGNETTASQMITVIDEEAPVFTFVPADMTLECDEEAVFEDAEAVDNCTDVTITISTQEIMDMDGNTITVRTFTATDDCGNSTTAVQNITFVNTNPPMFTFVPEDKVYECDEEIEFEDAEGIDDCGEVVVTEVRDTIPGECPANFTIERTFTLTNESGLTLTAVQIIEVVDTKAPEFLFIPEDKTVSCDVIDFESFPIVEDNCGEVDVVENTEFIDGDCEGRGTVIRTFTATDECGNVSTAQQVVTVVDDEGPVFTFVPADYTISCDEEIILDEAAAIDNCGEVTITEASTTVEGNCVGNFTITRVFTATDDCGNFVTAQQVITVVDEESPEFTFVPADYTIACDENPFFEVPTATDNCSSVNITESTFNED